MKRLSASRSADRYTSRTSRAGSNDAIVAPTEIPSLSIRGGVRLGSLPFSKRASLSGMPSASERLNERGRTLSVAIVATLRHLRKLSLARRCTNS